eukprot:scaffold40738_cov43-Cyclotella_meneghiniana.AAC.1
MEHRHNNQPNTTITTITNECGGRGRRGAAATTQQSTKADDNPSARTDLAGKLLMPTTLQPMTAMMKMTTPLLSFLSMPTRTCFPKLTDQESSYFSQQLVNQKNCNSNVNNIHKHPSYPSDISRSKESSGISQGVASRRRFHRTVEIPRDFTQRQGHQHPALAVV